MYSQEETEYGYDSDKHAFIFGINTPSGRSPVFLPIKKKFIDEAIYRGPGCLIDYGSGSSYQTDLEFHFTKHPPSVGSNVSRYGDEGVDPFCLLGPEARGWHETRDVQDWVVLGR